MWPHVWHMRRWTQRIPAARHSSQPGTGSGGSRSSIESRWVQEAMEPWSQPRKPGCSPCRSGGIRLPTGMAATLAPGVDQSRHGARERIAAVRGIRHGGVLFYAVSIALVAGAYYLAGRIGLELAYLDGAVAALWPPAGLGLAVLFLWGIRLWPGIVIGDLLLGDFSTPLGTVLGQTVGNTLAVVLAAMLLRRLTGGRGELERVVDVLSFVACAFVAALVSAAFGPLSLRLGDVIPADELARVFRTWTLGDASGV